tara:strand:+ start:243 stop:803 length:561 start_codon:yes stop_codon:yes gene_type:complete
MLCLRIIQQISFFVLLSLHIGCENDSISTAADNVDFNSQIDSSLQQIITQKIFEKTNAIRTSRGLSELAQNDDMDQLAQLHSNNMVEYNFYDHVDHQGKSPSQRADDLNFEWRRIAENIAEVPWRENVLKCGNTKSAELISECVIEGWRNSPGHLANMTGEFDQLGVGVAFTNDSIAYFTQVFRVP